jgi:DUF2075 family protein
MIKYAYYDDLQAFLNFLSTYGVDNFIDIVLIRDYKSAFGTEPSESEKKAWSDLLRNIAPVFSEASLPKTTRVFIELKMPLSSARADMMLLGKKDGKVSALIIEHKGWEDKSIKIKNNKIYVGNREELHPYLQAEGYALYLQDYLVALHNAEINYSAYLPNVQSEKLMQALSSNGEKTFNQKSVEKFIEFMRETINGGLTDKETRVFLSSPYAPSKTLVNQTVKAIKNQKSWILLDEQRLVYENIESCLEKDKESYHKVVLIVKGGPGTGKSAIALKLLGYSLEKNLSAVHITNSSSFTTTIKGILIRAGDFKQNRLDGMFRLSHNFIKVPHNSIDIAICDEAHRFRRSTDLYPYLVSRESQVYQIINAARISVFFVDENQIVRPGESGTVNYIIEQAKRFKNIEIREYELKTQFRNAGNENFVKWLDYVLGITQEPVYAETWNKEFEFKIFADIISLEEALRKKIQEGHTARLVAGFCWPWSDPDEEGNLPEDVVIGKWRRPWNRKRPNGRKLSPINDPYFEWATRDSNQLDEVGCIYSAQGFEFDYIGVIWGNDLRLMDKKMVAEPKASYDNLIKNKNREDEDIGKLLRNTYRVLLSRGMVGCYIYFLDEETKNHFMKNLKISLG